MRYHNEGAFEGDIILDPDERKSINSTHSYASIKGGRWPNGLVPYYIDESISARYRPAILAAIKDYSDYTCIHFREKMRTDMSYIRFRYGSGCSSPVGYRRGRVNSITLGSGCYRKGTIMHEIGHSVGFYHEQSRPDRDEYVRINFENIRMGDRYNFVKKSYGEIDSLGTPYDLESMMHYGTFAFSISIYQPAIETIDPTKNKLIGQRDGFSPIDVMQLNKMYNCPGGKKPLPPKVCEDKLEDCYVYVRRGDCTSRLTEHFMNKYCCRSCEDPSCYDVNVNCASYAADGYCTLPEYVGYMKRNCCRTCKDKAAN